MLNTSCGGKWIAFEDFVFVILEKEYPYLGLKAFTIKKDRKTALPGDLLQTAVSEIDAMGVYRVGYHTFTYYTYRAFARVYWGSEWSEEVLNPKLLYDVKYTFDGVLEDWHVVDGAGECVPIVETEQIELIFREDRTCEVYKNGELADTMSFFLTFDHSLNDFRELEFYNYKVLSVKGEEKTFKTKNLHIGGRYVVATIREYRMVDGVEFVREWSLYFRAA